ncbi:hypothetical protein EVAR_7675_1 [Eumeta japonica]|uniref:Uncharacterized protein n=1 Tax=Eumeta variegata TaxID=151549 RepID=A0A4C1TJI4_EUMVA|nr:hypothetical protein EVAR_7675_1 [Eumeta japonica]
MKTRWIVSEAQPQRRPPSSSSDSVITSFSAPCARGRARAAPPALQLFSFTPLPLRNYVARAGGARAPQPRSIAE